MEMMDLLKLLGILIVIIGFALKLDSILIIVVAAVLAWKDCWKPLGRVLYRTGAWQFLF